MKAKLFSIFFVAAILMMGIAPAQAASVIYDVGTGYAVGINQLIVDGDIYNVEFVADSYDGTYAVNDPLFLGDEAAAETAADAIMDALNNEAAVPVISDGSSEVLWVPYENDGQGGFYAEQTGHAQLTDPWQRFGVLFGSTATDYSGPPYSWLFARFTYVEPVINQILNFIDESVGLGTLTGYGPGNSGDNRLNALVNMLEEAQCLIEAGLFEEACDQLWDAYRKCDGNPKPPDFVAGGAADDLAGMILLLMDDLGC